MATIINLPNSNQLETSPYRLAESNGQMEVLYSGHPVVNQLSHFRQGCFYGYSAIDGKPICINREGNVEDIILPETTTRVSLLFSRSKIIAQSVSADGKRIELFSRDY